MSFRASIAASARVVFHLYETESAKSTCFPVGDHGDAYNFTVRGKQTPDFLFSRRVRQVAYVNTLGHFLAPRPLLHPTAYRVTVPDILKSGDIGGLYGLVHRFVPLHEIKPSFSIYDSGAFQWYFVSDGP